MLNSKKLIRFQLHKILRIFCILLIVHLFNNCQGQSSVLKEKFNALFEGKSISPRYYKGYLDKTLPVEIILGQNKETVLGYISYGNNGDLRLLDGRVNEEGFYNLYEFDDHSRVTASISGALNQTANHLEWYNSDFSLSMTLLLFSSEYEGQGMLTQYSDLNGKSRHLLFRDLRRQMSFQEAQDIDLRWMDFKCLGQECYENKPDVKLSNPIEFRLDPVKGNLLIYPDKLFSKTAEIGQGNRSFAEFDYFYSFHYPTLGKEEFDGWIRDEILRRITEVEKNKTPDSENSSQSHERFERRYYGDFFLSLLTDQLISGMLFFNNSASGRMETVAFNYDRQNHKFYKLSDFFRKDFDYSYFLQRYLEKKKRSLFYREKKMIRDMLEKENFTHYALTPGGLAFFTDFNVVYGRKHLLVPYEEIQSFIDDKSLGNFIKKK